MWKHAKQIAGGSIVALGALGVLLVTDIPAALEQSDKSFAFIAKSLGHTDPPLHFVSEAWAQPWFVILILVALFAIGVLGSWAIEALWKKYRTPPPSRPISAIRVDDRFYIDCDPVKDADGNDIADVFSIALCLWVTNSLETGSVLRNLQARIYTGVGESVLLPIRDVQAGSVDLRDGEVARIEVGRVYYRAIDNRVPVIVRGLGHFQTADARIVEGRTSPRLTRSLYVSQADGREACLGFTQMDPEWGALMVSVVVSADDTVSRVLNFQTNLFAAEPEEWLMRLPENGA